MQTSLLRRSKQLLLTFLFASISFLAVSQNDSNKIITLDYNSQLSLKQLGLHSNHSYLWELRDSLGNLVANSDLGLLQDYIFSIPGKFQLSYQELPSQIVSECNHGPASGMVELQVVDSKILFDVNQILFHNNLTSGQLLNGVELTIPFQVNRFNNQSKLINTADFRVSFQGIDCNIVATILNPQIIQTTGIFQLKVKLQGLAPEHTYIMIDFMDHHGRISTYYHTQEL